MYFDTHCHLSLCQSLSIKDQINLIRKKKIKKVIDPGLKISDFESRWEKLNFFPEVLFGIAIAPHYIQTGKDYSKDILQLKKILSQYPRVVAISEIGLEFYHIKDKKVRQKQEEIFYQQLLVAKDYNKPVFLHIRAAFNEAYKIVKESKWNKVVLHCYTGDYKIAKKFIELGAIISFSGIVTFEKSNELVEVAKKVPLENILTETDAPYLSPVPFRGRENFCHHLVEINKFIANLRKINLLNFNQKMWQNANLILGL